MSEAEIYELASRAVSALESIAGSLIEIANRPTYFGVDFAKPRDDRTEHSLEQIPGLDNLGTSGNGLIDAFTSDGNVVDHKTADGPKQVDAASIAREAEELLNAAATPGVSKEVDISDGERVAISLIKINLFHQERIPIEVLMDSSPDDPLIKEYLRRRDLPTQSVHLSNVVAAAIGIVYKHLPAEMWGTEIAAKAVAKFVEQHSEEQ